MSASNLNIGRTKLHQALKNLLLKWEAAREHWHDAASEHIEQEHLRPLEPKILAAVHGIEQLAQVVQQAEAACRPGE